MGGSLRVRLRSGRRRVGGSDGVIFKGNIWIGLDKFGCVVGYLGEGYSDILVYYGGEGV